MINIIEKAKIYGVDKVGSENPSALVRTDDAVGLSYYVGESDITSDFDTCYPFSDMQDMVDINGNIFVKIPKFYSKITKNADGTYKHQISGIRYGGYTTLFVDGKGNEIDYVLVGKYEASGSSTQAFSKSGQNVLVNITLPTMRSACKANGAGYILEDKLINDIIKELFLIEFATTNSQSIMTGYTASSNVAAISTGTTDTVKTPSGSPTSNTTGTYAFKYRGIENLWGNVWKFIDGITFDEEKIYICTDPEQYVSENTSMPYSYVGDRSQNAGFVKEINYFDKFPLLGFPTLVGGSDSTYYCDNYYYNANGTIMAVGGNWNLANGAGLWFDSGSNAASYAVPRIGGRLCYKPIV